MHYAPESNGSIENLNKQLRKMFWEVFIRINIWKWTDCLQTCFDSNNAQYNRAIKHTPNKLWHPDSLYNNLQNITRHLLLSIVTNFKPKTIRIGQGKLVIKSNKTKRNRTCWRILKRRLRESKNVINLFRNTTRGQIRR